MKKTLSAYIVAQNEEMYLCNALKSVKNIADEIIVVTDINLDRTVDIAKNFGAKVVYIPKGFDIIKKGWSEYENFGVKQCTKEWILKIDAEYKDTTKSTFNLWEGKKYKSNILKYKKDYKGHHPTQKPVLLLEDLIKTFSNENDLVVDLTMGSGSTLVACKNTNRNGIGIEKDPQYYAVAVARVDG